MDLSDLIPDVQLEASTIPDPLAMRELVRAARELLTFSLAWQVDAIVNLTGASQYFVYFPAELAEPVSASYAPTAGGASSRLLPTTVARLSAMNPSWRTLTGTPIEYYFNDLNTVVFTPNPTSGVVTLRVALRPTLDDPTIDDRVGAEFQEHIVHGALYRLLRMPKRSWSNADMAAFYKDLFETDKGQARDRAVDNFSKVPRQVRYGGL